MEKYDIKSIRKDVIGNDILFDTPFGKRHFLYADYTASGRGLKTIEDKIIADVESVHSRLETVNDQILVFEDSLLPLAQETFDTSRSEYISGKGSFIDLLDAERTLLKVKLNYIKKQLDYRLALADLERVVGGRIKIN